jgi:hypothetical protein
MIPWLSQGLTQVWLRFVVTFVIFGWLIYIAWAENRNYRNIAAQTNQQFNILRDDHRRAEAAMKALAAQVLRNTQTTSKSIEIIKQLPEESK